MNRHFYKSLVIALLMSAVSAVSWGQAPAVPDAAPAAGSAAAQAPTDTFEDSDEPVTNPVATTPGTPNPQLKPNPLDEMRKFEPAADEEYRLGRGDEITIDFAGRTDLRAKFWVGRRAGFS